MTPGFKRLLLAVCGLSLATTLLIGAGLLYVRHEGVIEVAVQTQGPHGCDVKVCVPAVVARLALALSPCHACCGDAMCKMDRWRPMIAELSRTFRDAPDFTMVEAKQGNQVVHISKSGPSLLVEVLSPQERVNVRMPFHLVSSIMSKT